MAAYTCHATCVEVGRDGDGDGDGAEDPDPELCSGCRGVIWSLGYPHQRCTRCNSRFHRGCTGANPTHRLPTHPHHEFLATGLISCPPPDPGAGPDAGAHAGLGDALGRTGSEDPDSQLTVMSEAQVRPLCGEWDWFPLLKDWISCPPTIASSANHSGPLPPSQ
jgi:hypothetical protein